MHDISHKLESVFRDIEQQRMQGMPMCNPNLQVQAVGFRAWGEYLLGVMVTPWFMNLMLVPANATASEALAHRQAGSKQTHVFPSGRYEFVNASEDGLGHYQVCSLFSPLLEFDNQHSVVAIARAALDELMQGENRDEISTHEKLVERLWHEDAAGDSDEAAVETKDKGVTERIEAPLSRRDFLRGRRGPRQEPGYGD